MDSGGCGRYGVPMTELFTVGDLAARFAVPVARVQYVLRVRGIEPMTWLRRCRVFDAGAVELVGIALHEARRHPRRKGRAK